MNIIYDRAAQFNLTEKIKVDGSTVRLFRNRNLKLNQFKLKLLRSKLTVFPCLFQKEKCQTTFKKICAETMGESGFSE